MVQGVSIARQKYSPIRLSINLGLCDRFPLFVNLSLDQIAAMLAEQHVKYNSDIPGTHELRAAFFQTFPDYPGFKVRLRPGDAYIAPAENMVHDGCTEGQMSCDV